MTRILIFSPYALWGVHTIYERTIAQACQVRGAELEYLLCDGLLPECDLHWDSKAKTSRPLDLCQRCQAMAKRDLQNVDIATRWLGEFLRPDERTKIFDWAQGLTPNQFGDASFEQEPLGRWVLASVISYFRKYPPDINDWRVATVYRGFLYSAAIVSAALRNYLDENRVDSALLFNGRQSIMRVALELFRERNIRVLTHERAEYHRGHINVRPNTHCMNLGPFHEFWKQWAHVPLRHEELEFAQKWISERQKGVNLAWIAFNRSSDSESSLRARLNLRQDQQLWALFTSSTDETAGDPEMKGPFESQQAWVSAVLRWVTSHQEVQLVIRVHPNLGGNAYIGEASDELKFYRELKSTATPNVTLVLPEDSVNSYALAQEADIGLTFGSMIGLEMAMFGKPVLLAARAIYENCSNIMTVSSKDSLLGMLEQCLACKANREIRREAFRLAYYYGCKFELEFKPLTVIGIYEAIPNYKQVEDLGPGKDASLDRICRYLMESEPLFADPSVDEQSRSTADEDRFFDELDRDTECGATAEVPRSKRLTGFHRSVKQLLRHI